MTLSNAWAYCKHSYPDRCAEIHYTIGGFADAPVIEGEGVTFWLASWRRRYPAIRTYSKSPGLLSMPTFGA